ncbi:hypothetical protein A2U01_0056643, partial [Trifolium medium]|nr:hypothetical protein [Trifolium medium]
ATYSVLELIAVGGLLMLGRNVSGCRATCFKPTFSSDLLVSIISCYGSGSGSLGL